MNTPGVSLFQGAESIKVNSTLERQEEEEALEDQRRRNEELENLLQNAFDDLEDNESTYDSTTNFQSDLCSNNQVIGAQKMHQQHTNSHQIEHNNNNNNNNDAFVSEIHNLKLLLESKTNELENIKKIANDESKKRHEYEKRLTIVEAELDRALAAKKNTHELLVESKEKCSNLNTNITKLCNEKKFLEEEKNDLLGKLETTQSLLADVQHKYDMVERDFHKRDDRTAELRVKQLEDRQRAEIEMIQQQMQLLQDNLEKRSKDLENMSTRYNALQSSHESMLVDKASKINELNRALDEAQQNCKVLRGKQDFQIECQRLQKLIANYQAQIASMEKTISTLTERLDFTTAELDVMDSLLHQHNMDDTPRRLSQTQGKVVGSTPLNTVDRVAHLKDELYRALANVKSKREEIRKLKQTLDEKHSEIRTLRAEENNSLVVITTLKEDKERLEHRLKALEAELETSSQQNKSLNDSKMLTLTTELQQLQAEHVKLQQEYEQLANERTQQELERKRIDVQLKNVEVDLEELKQEHDSMKINYEQILNENQQLRTRTTIDNMALELEKHKILLKDAQAECDRLKNLYVEISHAKEALAYEMNKLCESDNVKELQEQREKIAHLQRALQLAECRTSELSKIMETEKASHERDMTAMRDKLEKEKQSQVKAFKESSNNCTKCIDYMAEITKFEIQNLKLSNNNAVHKQEIDELTHELQSSKQVINELKEKLQLTENQERLIKELKVKATQFEDYIKTHSSSSERSTHASPTQKTQPQQVQEEVSSSNSISPELKKDTIKKIESRIRDEMAKIFATELKRFQIRLQHTEEKSACLQREYQHICAELQQRHNEVEILKQAILAERQKFEELTQHKHSEFQEILHKQKVMIHKCRDELQTKTLKITELMKELDERQTQIEAERKSMKAVMTQWEAQRKDVDAVEKEWRNKFEQLRETHNEAMLAAEKKYNCAKRTAANYKRYSDDKEAHMLREYERIKHEYELSLAKIEVRMNETLEKKGRELWRCALGSTEKNNVTKNDDKENRPKN